MDTPGSGCARIGCILFLIVLCVIVVGVVFTPRGNEVLTSVLQAPPVTPTPQVMVPYEAYTYALDSQAKVAIAGYVAIAQITLAHAAASISQNIAWVISMLIFGGLALFVLFGLGRAK